MNSSEKDPTSPFLKNPPTTKEELWAWYSYDWANSVYSIAAIGGYMPLLANDVAKRAADDSCQVYFGVVPIRPSSYASIFLSFSVLFQAIVFFCFSAAGDYGNMRKSLLIFFATTGSITTCLSFFITPENWWLGGVLMIITNVLFGASVVFYNAFLPLIIADLKEIQEFEGSESDFEDFRNKRSNEVSSYGFIAGYAGGLIVLILSVPILFVVPVKDEHTYECQDFEDDKIDEEWYDSIFAYQIIIFISGVWWLIFSIPTFYYLRARPGPSIPSGTNIVSLSLSRVKETITHIRELPTAGKYLLLYFVYSDGYTTISTVGALFAAEEIGMEGISLAILLVEIPLSALFGNYFFLWTHRRFGLSARDIININLIMFLILPLWGTIGFIKGSNIGLKTDWEMYLFAWIFGFNLGCVQSFSRTLFAQLTPIGRESEFFGFFELTDKGSSWVGPLVVGIVAQATDSLRFGLFSIVPFLLFPLFGMKNLDVAQGIKEKIEYEKIHQTNGNDEGTVGIRLDQNQTDDEEFEGNKRLSRRSDQNENSVEIQEVVTTE